MTEFLKHFMCQVRGIRSLTGMVSRHDLNFSWVKPFFFVDGTPYFQVDA